MQKVGSNFQPDHKTIHGKTRHFYTRAFKFTIFQGHKRISMWFSCVVLQFKTHKSGQIITSIAKEGMGSTDNSTRGYSNLLFYKDTREGSCSSRVWFSSLRCKSLGNLSPASQNSPWKDQTHCEPFQTDTGKNFSRFPWIKISMLSSSGSNTSKRHFKQGCFTEGPICLRPGAWDLSTQQQHRPWGSCLASPTWGVREDWKISTWNKVRMTVPNTHLGEWQI